MKGCYCLRPLLCLVGSLWIVSTEGTRSVPQTGHTAAHSQQSIINHDETMVHSNFFEPSPRAVAFMKKHPSEDETIGRYVAYRGGEFGGGGDDDSSDDNKSNKDKVAKSGSKLIKLSGLVRPLLLVGIGICIGLIQQQQLALSKDLETKAVSNEALQDELAKLKELLLEELSGVHEILEYEIKSTQTKVQGSLASMNTKLQNFASKTYTDSFARSLGARFEAVQAKVKSSEKRLGALEDTVDAVGNTMEAVESKVQQNSRSLHGLANEIERVSVKVTSDKVKDYYGQQQDDK